jgi:hypothetical protein
LAYATKNRFPPISFYHSSNKSLKDYLHFSRREQSSKESGF